jgi:hypothetical protein
MGIEKVMASSKLSVENAEFLDGWARRFRPYGVSQSSLMDLALRIVRRLEATGELSLEPPALQALLGTNGVPGSDRRKVRKA